jgi:hypothetical protein
MSRTVLVVAGVLLAVSGIVLAWITQRLRYPLAPTRVDPVRFPYEHVRKLSGYDFYDD